MRAKRDEPTRSGERAKAHPTEGDLLPSAHMALDDERTLARPAQEDSWRPPVRFGEVAVETEPLGWDPRQGFQRLFPAVPLPVQVVDRMAFGHSDLTPNRLLWGDSLHVARQLPDESVDLIYVDPPFFSGRQYKLSDRSELRSFSDTWKGGMPGYLIWLNARLHEMKRLLKKTGSIYVHCDWHAGHYIKVEMDKIFGYDNLINEVIWSYRSGGGSKRHFGKKHDTLLFYAKDASSYRFFPDAVRVPYDAVIAKSRRHMFSKKGKVSPDVWSIPRPPNHSKEWIGYPTQKPESLLEMVIKSATERGDVVADFFCGGGTAPAVAERLGRRWIACDQSRVAVVVTADRILRLVEGKIGSVPEAPDFTVEHWGVYVADRFSEMSAGEFREFVLGAFGAVPERSRRGIHGWRKGVPVWVGKPEMDVQVTAEDVLRFADVLRGTTACPQGPLPGGIVLAWTFRADAMEVAARLRKDEPTGPDPLHLEMIRMDSPRFREHVTKLSTDHADYENLLTFVRSPKIEAGWKRIGPRRYLFDASKSVVRNPGARIVGVQWSFDCGENSLRTPGCSFVLGKKSGPSLQTAYEFPRAAKVRIACRIQDDLGGAGMWSGELDVT